MAGFRRIANLFRRARVDREIDAELQAHIAMRIDDNVAAGMTPEEARRDALVRFGNPVATRERVAATDVNLDFGSIGRNVRYALRQLRRSPGFALTAILALALGIGPNVAIFSIIWGTFLAPLPYPNAKQLVVVWMHYKGERQPVSGDDYAEFAAQNHTFQRLDFQSWVILHLTNPDHSQDVEAGLPFTPGFITETMGERMFMGRDFRPDEGTPGNDHVVILSHWLWQERYNSDRNILGKSILIEDEPYTVIGVDSPGPNDNAGHAHGGGVDFNVPLILRPGVHTHQFGSMIGRLKPGITLAQAQADLSVIDRRLASQRNGGKDLNSSSLTVEQFRNDWLDHKLARKMWLLFAAVGLVLLIACANVANLLLARGASRRQELAVRSALGATRGQIFVQLLTESLTLALAGGAVGIAMGWGLMKLSMALLPGFVNMSSEAVVEMNLPVLGFALGATLLAGILFGCVPGWQAARLNLSDTLKQGARSVAGRGRAPAQAMLVTVEVALALILLAGAGMALHSFWNLSHIDTGFNANHVLVANMRPRDSVARGGKSAVQSPQQVVVRQRQLLDRLRRVPGVANAALATSMPMHGHDTYPFAVAGQPVDNNHLPVADLETVTPSYFDTLGIRLLRGRFLSESDSLGSPLVVMVNETFVRRYLPNLDPLTQRLMLQPPSIVSDGHLAPTPVPFQIVGVFHDVLDNDHLTGEVQPEIDISQWQAAWPYVDVAVRTFVEDPAWLTRSLQSAVASIDSDAAIEHVETMREVVDAQQSSDRFGMVLFGSFAFVALLLAALGIYGVMSFAVAQRTHEIGVRMALGAQRSEVVALMVRGGMRLALIGIVIGLAGAFGLGRLMHSTLYGVAAVDAESLAAVAVLLLGVAAAACWLPARRSAGIDPMRALREE